MTCPVCEGKTKVVGGHDFGDHVVRRRKCLVCDHAFYTEETDGKTAEAEYLEHMRSVNAELRRKRRGNELRENK